MVPWGPGPLGIAKEKMAAEGKFEFLDFMTCSFFRHHKKYDRKLTSFSTIS